MAEEKKTAFPKIPEKNWWRLREQFKKKVLSPVTPSILASMLSMDQKSARGNLITPMKKIGLLNEDGTPSELAFDWRLDDKYPEVCEKIRTKIYPKELRDAFADKDADQKKIENWFMETARVGDKAASMFASFYKLLLEADPSRAAEALKEKPSKRAPEREKEKVKEAKKGKEKTKTDEDEGVGYKGFPSLHLNIQIHIAADTSPEQIDKIFSSMARHLKDFRVGSS